MVGSISLSLSQQFDKYGTPLGGGKLYFRQAGTVATPQNAYQDAALTIPHPNPIILNDAGRVPQFYLADGSIKIDLNDHLDVNQLTADNILVIGPSSGGGGGGGVDPTTVFYTGDIKFAYGTAVLSGFVRFNGRTIGSATSGATERANSDTQALFIYLWTADPNLIVSGGRTTAAADFAANKTIALPDARGFALAGLDDMGNSARGVFAGAAFTAGGNATTLGSYLGTPRHSLLLANLPAYTPAGTYSTSLAGGTLNSGTLNSGTLNSGTIASGNLAIPSRNFAPTAGAGNDATHLSVGNSAGADVGLTNWGALTGTVTGTVSGTVSGTVTGTVSGSITGTAQGGTSAAFDTQSTYLLITIYIKL